MADARDENPEAQSAGQSFRCHRPGADDLIALIDKTGAGLMAVDREFRIVWHNATMAEICQSDALTGRRCHEAVTGRECLCDGCLAKATFETGRPHCGTVTIYNEDEEPRGYSITAAPVVGDDGGIRTVLEMIQSVTTLRSTQSQLARYKRLVDNSEDFMIVTDRNGEILAVNRRITTELGYSERELVGRNAVILFPEFERHRGPEIGERTVVNASLVDFIHLQRKDGTLIPTQVFILFDEEQLVQEVIFCDLSERLRMESEIRKRSEQLAEQFRQVRAAMQEKERFFRHVSHDMRTPLTSIIGFTQFMLDDEEEPAGRRQRLALRRIEASAQKLLALIDDLVDLSKLEAHKMETELAEVSLADLLEQIAASMAPLAEQKGLSLTLDTSADLPSIATDQAKLTRILNNLVSNAIKFTKSGGVKLAAEKNAEANAREREMLAWQVKEISGLGFDAGSPSGHGR